jgi:hypothetical protein
VKIKTSEATPLQLNWLVAQCEGKGVEYLDDGITRCLLQKPCGFYVPTTDWAQGGSIIERENISVAGKDHLHDCWAAMNQYGRNMQNGPTPLIAAMRCYVVAKLGDEVEIPEELK